MLMDGNALAGIDRVGQRVTGLYRMVPRDAQVGTSARTGTDFYTGDA